MKKSFYPWVVVALLWVVAALNYLDRQVIYSIFPLLHSQLHVTNVQLGFLGAGFLWVYALASPLGGYLADRFNRRAVILLSLAVWSLVTFLIGLARNYPQLLVAQGLMGISEACYLPAALALIADYHGGASRSRAIGLHQSGLYAGVALGGFSGGWIGQHYGWHQVFYLLGSCGVLYMFILFFGLKNAPKRDNISVPALLPFNTAMRELSSIKNFWILALATSFSAIAFWCVYTWLALFLFERYHLSLTVAGFSSTFYIQAASFAGVIGGGWLADSWSKFNRKARVWTQVIGFLLAGPALFIVGGTISWTLLLPCLVGFGLGRGFWDCNLMPVLCQIVPKRLRASGYGILNSTSCLAGGAMAAAGGILKMHFGLGRAIQVSAMFMIASAACLALLKIRIHSTSGDDSPTDPEVARAPLICE